MAEPKTGPKWSKFWVTAKYVGKNTQYKVGKNFYYRSQNPFISRKYAFNQIVKKYFKIQISFVKNHSGVIWSHSAHIKDIILVAILNKLWAMLKFLKF